MSVLFVPGLGGVNVNHWQPWLAARQSSAVLVQQSDWHKPDLNDWLTSLAKALEEHPGSILVAHHLGCALVAHFAAQRPDLHIGGALLVAPADVEDRTRTPPEVGSFAPLPLERLPFPSIVVGSSGDRSVSIGRAMMFAFAWASRFVHLRDGGSIDVASGFGPWRNGLHLIEKLKRSACPGRPYLHLVQAGAAGLV